LKYAESEPSIGIMSRRTGASASLTTTGGILLVGASPGARTLTHIVAPITAQNSVAQMREIRATLLLRM
jgi:hypothetical protein